MPGGMLGGNGRVPGGWSYTACQTLNDRDVNINLRTVSTMTSRVLSGLTIRLAELQSLTFSDDTRKKNCRYLPRRVYTFAGPA